MKLNRKGFVITAILYGLLLLFVMLVSSYLLILSAKKNRIDNLVKNAEDRYFHPENYVGGTEESGSGIHTSNDKVTIIFDSNGGTPTLLASIEVDKGKTISQISLPNDLSKDGFTFGGWTNKKFDTTPIDEEYVLDEDILKLYAIWKKTSSGTQTPETVTITFDPDGGTVTPSSREVVIGTPIGDLPTPTKTNCTFNNSWYDSPHGEGNVITENTTFSENKTIYANWNCNVAKITVEKFVDGVSAGNVVSNVAVTNGTWGPTTIESPQYSTSRAGTYISTECSPSDAIISAILEKNGVKLTISGITSTTYCRVNFNS